MAGQAEGFVTKIFTKSGNSPRGKWVADSFKIADAEGNEDSFFYQMGFREKGKLDVPPAFVEGDYIRFQYEDKDATARSYKPGTGVKVGNAPARPQQSATSSQGASTGAAGHGTQQNIHYQNSRTAAIELVDVLLSHNALPITGAKTKAGEAARYEEIVDSVNKLTVQFFNDLETFRLFETVSDAGVVDTSADEELPEDEEPEVTVTEDGDEPI